MKDDDVKPKKPRKKRVDSKEGVADAIVAAGRSIVVPADAKLNTKERKVFTELTEEFSKSELSPHKVRLLVTLAKQIVLLEREQITLMEEGFSLTNSHGNAVPNPRARACGTLSASILAMRRSLGIHTRAQAGGDNREAAKRRAINKSNEAGRDGYDNLIAFPGTETDDDDSIH